MALRVVTVFGGSGFIGRHLVQRLAQTGAQVRVVVRDLEKAKSLKPMGAVGQIVPMRADITDPAAIARAIDGADAVVNLLGVLAETGTQRFQTIQAEAPGLIAGAAAKAGVKALVHVSAIGADADSPSVYAQTKAAGEAAVKAAFPKATILRPSIVFGPEDGFFNRFAAMARNLPLLPLIGGGLTRFQPVYVGDVADAIMAGLTRPDAAGRVFELGGPRIYTFEELLTYILHTIRVKRMLVPLPWAVAEMQAAVLELVPGKPLTRDQVALLKRDNLVGTGMPGLADLGIAPHSVEAIVPAYLSRFRPGGRFAGVARA